MSRDKSNGTNLPAIAFFTENLERDWSEAIMYATPNGKIATLPDIIEIISRMPDNTWKLQTWFTAHTALYLGLGKDGSPLCIIAHGTIGPMGTIEGILEAYEVGEKTETFATSGLITRDTFLKLEAGDFGHVSIINIEDLRKRYRDRHSDLSFPLTAQECLNEPLIGALFADQSKSFIEWLTIQTQAAQRAYLQDDRVDADPEIFDFTWFGNLLFHSEFEQEIRNSAKASLLYFTFEIRDSDTRHPVMAKITARNWDDSFKPVGIPANTTCSRIVNDLDVTGSITDEWQRFMKPADNVPLSGIRKIEWFDNTLFTTYPQEGFGFDTNEPECLIITYERVGKPTSFKRSSKGRNYRTQYDPKDIQTLCPQGANAYMLREHDADDEKVDIEFYKITFDQTRRLPKKIEIFNNKDLLLEFLSSGSED